MMWFLGYIVLMFVWMIVLFGIYGTEEYERRYGKAEPKLALTASILSGALWPLFMTLLAFLFIRNKFFR
jgi:threonine/homoserine/homoserine lactone efflux protein